MHFPFLVCYQILNLEINNKDKLYVGNLDAKQLYPCKDTVKAYQDVMLNGDR